MAVDGVRRFLDGLGGGPYRLTLRWVEGRFVLACFRGDTPAPFAHLLQSYPQLDVLRRFAKLKGVAAVVPLGRLHGLRRSMSALGGERLAVSVGAEVESFRLAEPPDGFSVSYDWEAATGRIVRQVSDGADYYGDGWFTDGERGWEVPGVRGSDDAWLRQAAIAGSDIPRFLGEAAADWADRAVPFACSVRHDSEPALTLRVRAVSDDSADLAVTWNVAPEAVEPVPDLPGYVLARGVVRPGITPAALAADVGDDGTPANGEALRLSGQAVPRFLRDVWPHVRAWAEGEVTALEAQHGLITAPARLILVAQSEVQDGLGHAVGVPTVVVAGAAVTAESLSRALRVGTEFVRLPGGWLPVGAVRALGIGPMGRLVDGSRLTPVHLSPLEVLRHGSLRLSQRWESLDFSAVRLPQGDSEAEAAAQHLRFLLAWGIPGGLIGDREANWQALTAALVRLAGEHPALRILVVGTKKALDGAGRGLAATAIRRWDSGDGQPLPRGDQPGISVATPRGLGAHPDLATRRWDLLCLLGADDLIRSGQSQLYRHLAAGRVPYALGLFASREFADRPNASAALCRLFRVLDDWDGDLIWQFGLRDPTEPAGTVPEYRPPRMAPGPHLRPGWAAEMHMQPAPPSQPMAVPLPLPRPAVPLPGTPSVASAAERMAELMALAIGPAQAGPADTDGFLAEARAYESRVEEQARRVPFQGFWPTYGAMTAEQQRWYFCWRGCVRRGEYPDTDIAYLFVHVYELINRVGAAEADDGFEQLHRLWLQYRDRLRRLDDYLVPWLADYAALYGCAVGPLKVYAEAAALGMPFVKPDLLLAAYAGQSLASLTLPLLESLCDHVILGGKFYEGHRQELEEGIPKAIAAVDRAIRAGYGGGLLELFKPPLAVPLMRQPFRGARYGGEVRRLILVEVLPYSDHPPFREFLTAVVKHAENCLRQKYGYSGRLRGYTLEADVVAAIEEALLGKKAAPPAPPRPVVRIDLTRAEAIARESDLVRDMLLVAEAEEEQRVGEAGAEVVVTVAPEADGDDAGEAGLSSYGELDEEWSALAEGLAGHHLVALAAISDGDDVRATLRRLAEEHATMPAALVDEINELAVEAIGDIIIDPAADPPAVVAENVEAVRKLIAAAR